VPKETSPIIVQKSTLIISFLRTASHIFACLKPEIEEDGKMETIRTYTRDEAYMICISADLPTILNSVSQFLQKNVLILNRQ
jgi:hypothetical protein